MNARTRLLSPTSAERTPADLSHPLEDRSRASRPFRMAAIGWRCLRWLINPRQLTSTARLVAFAIWLAASGAARAFPPAPHHTLYGVVRDELGQPLAIPQAEIVLETLTGVCLKTPVVPGLRPGMNYRLAVPMDAGLTADSYRPTALRPSVAFQLRVKIGQLTYLPLELRGRYANLGQPARSTRLDLTLGEDTDGDGLPDAWERALMAMLGGGLTLADIRPGDDPDGDGLSNLQEYLAGTYAFDPQDGFRLDILGLREQRPVLAFLAIRGRTYTVQGSADLETWLPVAFRLADDGPTAPPLRAYYARDVRVIYLEAEVPPEASIQAFKLLAQ